MLSRFGEMHVYRWALFSPVCLSFGAAWYFSRTLEPVMWVYILPTVVCALIVFFFKNKLSVPIYYLSWALFWCCLGVSVSGLKTALYSDQPHYTPTGSPQRIEGILQEVQYGERGNRLLIRVTAMSGVAMSNTPKFVRITQREHSSLQPGRHISCFANLLAPPGPQLPAEYDFQRTAYFMGLGAVGYVWGKCEPIGTVFRIKDSLEERLIVKLNAIRRSIAKYVFEITKSDGAAMAAAMITGDRSYLSPEVQANLRGSGLAHLLAISGLHMGLASGVFFSIAYFTLSRIELFALRFPLKKIAAIAALCALSLYLLLSGFSVATQRAYIMAAVGFGAILVDRPAISFRSLAIAMILVTLLQPETVLTPGYQMSFSATASLIALYETWPRYQRTQGHKLLNWFASLCATSVVASLATMPFAAFHFGQIAIYGVLCNLLVMPIVSLLTVPLAAFALLTTPLGYSDFFLRIMSNTLDLILGMAHFWSSKGELKEGIYFNEGALVGAIFTIVMVLFFSGRLKVLAAIPALMSFVILMKIHTPVMHITAKGDVYYFQEEQWHLFRLDERNEKNMKPFSMHAEVNQVSLPMDTVIDEKRQVSFVRRCEGEGVPILADVNFVRLEKNGKKLCVALNQKNNVSISIYESVWGSWSQKNELVKQRPWSRH